MRSRLNQGSHAGVLTSTPRFTFPPHMPPPGCPLDDFSLLRVARLADITRARHRSSVTSALRPPATRALTEGAPWPRTIWPRPANCPWLRAVSNIAFAPTRDRPCSGGHHVDPADLQPSTSAVHRAAWVWAYVMHGPAVSPAGRKRTRLYHCTLWPFPGRLFRCHLTGLLGWLWFQPWPTSYLRGATCDAPPVAM